LPIETKELSTPFTSMIQPEGKILGAKDLIQLKAALGGNSFQSLPLRGTQATTSRKDSRSDRRSKATNRIQVLSEIPLAITGCS
jgi:hypothetical protein